MTEGAPLLELRGAVLAVTLGLLAVVGAGPPGSGAAGAAVTGTSWTVYHGSETGDGVAAGVASVDLAAPAWRSPVLDGQLYGEPLVSGGRVFVATEANTVYALSATTGAVSWSTHLGTPVPATSLPCGNISPTVGITGTPVLDPGRNELFVVADELVGGTPTHVLVGLDASSGRTRLSQRVDPPGATPATLLQRTGLTLDAGRVVFGYGGNYGDCGLYRGWVVSVPEAGGTPAEFAVDAAQGESKGAVWMGGAAPVVDASGNVWVTTGNGSVTSSGHAYDHSEAVLELSPAMTLRQYFAPSSWAADNARDLDLSTAPALLGSGQVVAAGKGRTVYLLDGARLGGIGGEQASLPGACSDDIAGGVAVEGQVVYLPCLSGTVAVHADAATPGLALLWRSSAGGGPPIVAAGLVWTISQGGVLSGLDPSTGSVRQQATVGAPANHFPTPAVGGGVLLVPAADRVTAFAAPTAGTTTTTAASTTSTTRARVTTTTTPASLGGTDPWPVVAAVAGGLALAAGAAWALWRRRLRRRRGAQ